MILSLIWRCPVPSLDPAHLHLVSHLDPQQLCRVSIPDGDLQVPVAPDECHQAHAVEYMPSDVAITAQSLTSAYAQTGPLFDNGLLHLDEANRLQVYLRISSGTDLEALYGKLGAAGVVIERADPEGTTIQAAVPLRYLQALELITSILAVTLPNYGFTNVGSAQSEGDTLLDFDDIRDAFGVDGSGVTVGVISDGIFGLADAIAAGDLPATGVTAGQEVTGDLDLTLGTLTVDTTDGTGTVLIDLGGGLSVEGDAALEVTTAGINVEIHNPQLVFKPEAPDATLLLGGSASVTEVGIDFSVDLDNLPGDASLSVQFAKVPSVFVESPDITLQLSVGKIGGFIENPEEDIAFAVNVTKSGITNQDLGTNSVTMTVSSAWYDQRLAEDKEIAVSKIDDQGGLFASGATCEVNEELATCSTEFSGAAEGFSTFILLAIAAAPEPMPTPVLGVPTTTLTPTVVVPTPSLVPPTATPTPSPVTPVAPLPPTPTAMVSAPTPAPTPTVASAFDEPAGGSAIVIIVAAIVALAAVSGGGVFLVRRRRVRGA